LRIILVGDTFDRVVCGGVHKKIYLVKKCFWKAKNLQFFFKKKLRLLELARTGSCWHPCEDCQTNLAATMEPPNVVAATITVAAKHK